MIPQSSTIFYHSLPSSSSTISYHLLLSSTISYHPLPSSTSTICYYLLPSSTILYHLLPLFCLFSHHFPCCISSKQMEKPGLRPVYADVMPQFGISALQHHKRAQCGQSEKTPFPSPHAVPLLLLGPRLLTICHCVYARRRTTVA